MMHTAHSWAAYWWTTSNVFLIMVQLDPVILTLHFRHFSFFWKKNHQKDENF